MDGRAKKLLNNVSNAVKEHLQGLTYAHPGLRLAEDDNIIYRYDVDELKKDGKVAVLSGGGSGHEPAMAGFVGSGMLTAAVAGSIFTSPPSNSILNGIRIVGKNNPAGVLVIVFNYTGDRLNFGIAIEHARSEGVKVDSVVVGEDCAFQSYEKTAGRRGLCGGILILKVAGAMSEAGKSLEEISDTLRKIVLAMGTISICLSVCNIPNSGRSFELQNDEMELGLGVHGEAGIKRLKVLPCKEVVKLMFDHMTDTNSSSGLHLKRGDRVALIVNNLGGMSRLEMNVAINDAVKYLVDSLGLAVERIICGTMMSSLEMAGLSLTLVKTDDETVAYIDAPTEAPAWPKRYSSRVVTTTTTPSSEKTFVKYGEISSGPELGPEGERKMKLSLIAACQALAEKDALLNKLDQESGDGDCGSTLKTGAETILEFVSSGAKLSHPKDVLLHLSTLVQGSMGGTSGALYGLFFASGSRAFTTDCSPATWCLALKLGLEAICKFGGAEPGDRTMVDALAASCRVLSEMKEGHEKEILEAAVRGAEEAVSNTITMKARAGRASYVSADRLKQPDPGAYAVAIWMTAIYKALF